MENIYNETDIIYNITTNYTEINEDNFSYDFQVINKWITGVFFCVVLIGVCLNVYLITCVFQQKKNGALYIVLQISIIDLICTWIAISEVWSLLKNSWTFSSNLCPLFLGSEIVINTISIYLHVLLNFHTISVWNIQKNIEMCNKNPLTRDVDDSMECLVSRSESSIQNRTVHIDYRQKKTTVSIILPCLLIWFCCLSLSIPEFSLSTIVENFNNHTLCTMVDLHYGQLIRRLLIVFRCIIPIPLLVLTFSAVLLISCNDSLMSIVKKSSLKKFEELRKLFQLSLSLTLLYLILSLQRSVFYFLHNTSEYFDNNDKFKFAPLDSLILPRHINMWLSIMHYSSIVVRPILCILAMPFIMNNLKKCFCKGKRKDDS